MHSPCNDCIHSDECDNFDKILCAENDYDRYLSEIHYYDYYDNINLDEDD